ncbi:hypothetical protein BSZ32_00435 [Rubritalea profundi]|uniref:Cytochrome c domain-containing protein n=2 Tax=Rubritalea profundi TaxID=1658618 RepID=A0A2S7TY06_9BACT|nr:hypothetical protein BSZ32_00435 [Rubritalea profundi]
MKLYTGCSEPVSPSVCVQSASALRFVLDKTPDKKQFPRNFQAIALNQFMKFLLSRHSMVAVSTLLLLPLSPLSAVPDASAKKIEGTASEEPVKVIESDEAILATISYPDDMKAGIFAREPDVFNATAISMDEQNRLFVAETHRFDRGIEDNRRNWYWLRDEVGLKTTADRLALLEKYADKKTPGYYTEHAEKIRVLEDKNGDGKAERSWIYADGFNNPLDGTAAGIMAANGKVYFACIPNVWMLEDKNGDGVSDTRTSLQEGYGISVSLSGHDLNGFAFGPDGRIYFTIGDRGYDLKTADGRHLYDQYGGAIFRMEPDGSNLEVVHYNLRNPKEIAFDQYGVAFSVDNNADMGDKARVVQMVEGAMSGWNRGNQSFRNWPHAIDVTRRHETPWMAESWWKIEAKNRPKAFLPPAGHVSVGPSGLAYNPGIGLSKKWDNNFFVCDYRGGGSEVIGFEMNPMGAGYKVASNETFIKGFLNTDIEFGFDGKVYVSDFTGGWKTYDFGTIFVFYNPVEIAKPVVAEVKSLFANGFDSLSPEKLAQLLQHQDLRVRQRAQFALAGSPKNRTHFVAATASANPLITRLHGVWGLGQLSRTHKDKASTENLVKLTQDEHWRVRGQASQALGFSAAQIGRKALIERLTDKHPNTRMLAATALGKLGHREDVPHLIKVLEQNSNGDAYLRHGAVNGLRLIAEANKTAEDLLKFKNHKSAEVRLGLIIALRRLAAPGIAHFLKDSDPALVIETVQAINDGYIEGARAALAAQTQLVGTSSVPIDYRIINSIVRLGNPKGILSLLAMAENEKLPDDSRIECLFQLARWEKPPAGDPTTGKIRPITGDRSLETVRPQITKSLERLLDQANGKVLAEVLKTGNKFGVSTSQETLRAQLLNDDNIREVRLAALKNLLNNKDSKLIKTLQKSLRAKEPEVRRSSLQALTKLSSKVALKESQRMLESKSPFDRQIAIRALASIKDKKATASILAMLKTIENQPIEVHLDIIETAKAAGDPGLTKALEAYEAKLSKDDPLAAFQVTLAGGDIGKGRAVLYGHGAAQCTRCHKADPNRKGGVAGPDLKNAGKKHNAAYLLESLILPNARIASGFGMVSLTMKDGSLLAGMLAKDTPESITITSLADGKESTHLRKDIASVSQAMSTMPPMGHMLTKKEIRDLIAYLQSLKF